MSISDEKIADIILKHKLLTKKALAEAQDTAKNSAISLYNAAITDNLVDKNGVHLAVNDPENTDFISNFSKRADNDVVVYFADEESIKKVLSARDTADNDLATLLKTVQRAGPTEKAEDIPVIEIVHKILEMSFNNKSSDVHIEPHEHLTLVRFRIDGVLHDIVELPNHLHDLIITRIKIMARLRTDEHRAAQDGKLKFTVGDENVDVRVSIIPLIWGEKVVMRLLSEKVTQYDLATLGFRPTDLEKITRQIGTPWGMILATGPTGCGKTTTLYSILKYVDSPGKNIVTVEDPVEYQIKGINQVNIRPSVGLTFPTSLRSILRQDPNIIMIGEIRDTETLDIAVKAALTGHLVLSSLHTTTAAGSIVRMENMGIEPFLISSSVLAIVAQRLLRKICAYCKEPQVISRPVAERIGLLKLAHINKEVELFRGKGCKRCFQTGYKGRVGITEVLIFSQQIKELVLARAGEPKIKAAGRAEGMKTMREDGLAKAVAGLTTLEEVLRVTAADE